ncbi:MAG: hypothetical protein ACQEQF_00425 [Bacillota bacterium]
MANKILLKGSPISKEAEASGAVTPGMLLERTSNGTVKAHSSANGNAAKIFADNEDYMGEGIDTDYADGDRVKFLFCKPGDEINALLTSGATSYSVGDMLASDGSGYLQAYTTTGADGESIVGQVIEATTGSTGSNDRIKIEVI